MIIIEDKARKKIGMSKVQQGCCLTIFQGAQKGKSQKVRSPTGNVLGAAAKI